jgi:transcriptional regulator with XRE-family HTH domain
MEIADRLKSIRSFLGKTQKEMAATLGVSLGSWQAYEAGSSYPGGRVLEELARLGVNSNWVLLEEGEMMRGQETIDSGLPVDKQVLWEVIVRVERIFARLSKPWPPEKKAELIVLLHDEVMEGELKSEDVEKNVLRIVKLAS